MPKHRERLSSFRNFVFVCLLGAFSGRSADLTAINNPLRLPEVGDFGLRILSPSVLELTLITTKDPDPASPREWNFVGTNFQLNLPPAADFRVTLANAPVPVETVGFKRRVIYAPLKKRDLRIGNYLYLKLAKPVAQGQKVGVEMPNSGAGISPMRFSALVDPRRWTPVIHVNQTGYIPGYPKRAMIGWFMGNLGELLAPGLTEFKLIERSSGRDVFEGKLTARPDRGFPFPCYQQVAEADFSAFNIPGEYEVFVPGLGISSPFFINEAIPAAFARDYALGLYHQRCGTNNALPFTRFTHDPCHTAPAEIPTIQFKGVQAFLREMTDDFKSNPRHTAPQLKDVNASLYPFVNQGKVDVSGGHHDAGDYSKYTINSAALIHYLIFAADVFPGAGELDNLGLPESGDGKSDLLQEAKWEADFLAKMQDADGGFYFLVYPRDRQYEDNVLPDKGDPQVVFPKNTAATAAAVAALAQASSSSLFRRQFPIEAALYLKKAEFGWRFLEKAFAKFGRDGAYQKITHYGNEFQHDDEIAWAATELFLATGDERFQKEVITHFDPADRETRRWTWWRLFESYGCLIRSYAFAAKTGRIQAAKLDPIFLGKCQEELLAAAQDQVRYMADSAYGTAFPDASKRFRNAGWYFSMDRAFDLAAAAEIDHPAARSERPKFIDALISNMNYEGGCNPVNICFLTGLGWRWPREIVHHYAQNDRRTLPPSGLPIGNVQEGFQFLHPYQKELGALSYPPDGATGAPYPFYDRWGDSFNVTTEFVIVNQARGLAALAWLMAANPALRTSHPRSAQFSVSRDASGTFTAQLSPMRSRPFDQARYVWEAGGHEPKFGTNKETFTFPNGKASDQWIEMEAWFPDGERFFGVSDHR